jgi:NitT/TauT family transport system ATP-binding protein
MTALSVDIRRKAFSGSEIIRGLEFAVAPGEFVALVGPSGCGKSTLLNLISQLDDDFDGRIEHASGERLGFMFQSPRLMPWLSARDNVALVCDEPKASLVEADRLLTDVGLGERCDAWPNQLSGGQQRRVALARAFITAPSLLLMDEPFVSLDAPTANALREQLLALWRAHSPAIVYVTHELREALTLADRVLFLGSPPAGILLDYRVPLTRPRSGNIDAGEIAALQVELLARYPNLLSGSLD